MAVHDARTHKRSTRDRPAKAPLSEQVIVDAALEILRAEGLDAVTMRSVAAELDTGPASLYVYIRGRDELREAILDRVSSTIELERRIRTGGANRFIRCWAVCCVRSRLILGSRRWRSPIFRPRSTRWTPPRT